MMKEKNTGKVLSCLLSLIFILSATLSAQTADKINRLKMLAAQVEAFGVRCPQEKVYLHFDNTAYFQGDNIYYKAYVVNATTLKEAASKVLYVELVSPTGVVLKQQKLKIENGGCHGCFPLVDEPVAFARSLRGAQSYPSGYYEVRAYTREMQNFDNAYIFSRVFPVYVKPQKEGNYDNPVLQQYKTRIDVVRPKGDNLDKVNASFFPEGGNLVMGLPCQVAFKITGKDGSPLQASGAVEKNVPFATFHDGMGVFEFIPQKKSNKAVVTFEGKDYSFDLPDALPQGIALAADPTSGDNLTFTVRGSSAYNGKLLGYTLMCRERILRFDTLTATQEGTLRSCPLAGYPAGVYQLTLFDESGQLFGDRLIFVSAPMQSKIAVTQPSHNLQPFEKVKMGITVTGEEQQPVASTFSIAVRDGSDYGTSYSDNIYTDLLLSSELRGYIYKPEFYFEKDDKRHRLALDMLMRVQGWHRYEWKNMAGVTPFKANYFIEQGLVLDGNVLSRIRKKPLENINVSIVAHSPDRSQKQENHVVTDSAGSFGFQFADFTGKWDLTLAIRDKDHDLKDARIVIVRSQKPNILPFDPLSLSLPLHTTLKDVLDAADDSLTSKEKGDTPEQLAPDAVHLKEVVITQKRKYVDYCTFKAFDSGEATEEVLDMGDFTPQVYDYLRNLGYDIDLDPDFQDSAISLTPIGINYEEFVCKAMPIFKLKGGLIFWQINRTGKWKKVLPTANPWYIDLEEVKSVIVYDSPVEYASLDFIRPYLGAINDSMNSYKNHRLYVVQLIPYDEGEAPLFDKGVRNTTLIGYSEVKEFYNPSYDQGVVKGETDYRRTLYWNPDVKCGADGTTSVEFYNNSRCRALSVSAQGITSEGLPVVNK